MNSIILASGSEGRRELFQQTFGNNFSIDISELDETQFTASTPKELVTTLAKEKALVSHKKFPNDFVCAFDTVVSCDNIILGKPTNIEEAKKMLLFLNDKIQVVWTGYAFTYKDIIEFGASHANLIFSMTEEQINTYIEKHPVTKFAGSYAIQKDDSNIKIISGEMDTIIGAPMQIVKNFINRYQD